MTLRGRLLLGGLITMVACAVIGTQVIAWRAQARGVEVLDRELGMGAIALDRQVTLRRAQLAGVMTGISKQSYFRAYMLANDRGQMGYFAQAGLTAGADAVAITDARGGLLAAAGDGAADLATLAKPGHEGGLLALGGGLANAAVVRVGGDNVVGYVIGARLVQRDTLITDATPFGMQAALSAGSVMVSTDGVLVDAKARAGTTTVTTSGAARWRIERRAVGGGLLSVALPFSRVDGLIADLTNSTAAVLLILIILALGSTLLLIGQITRPINVIRDAATDLGAGRFGDAVKRLRPLIKRTDEIGELARSYADAAERLSVTMNTCARLSFDIERALTRANRLVTPTEQRSNQETLAPLISAIETLVAALSGVGQTMGDVRGGLRNTANELSRAEAATSAMSAAIDRGRSLLALADEKLGESDDARSRDLQRVMRQIGQQLANLETALANHTGGVRGAVEAIGDLRAAIERARSEQVREQHEKTVAVRAIDKIQRLTRAYAEEALTVRSTVTALGRHVEELRDALSMAK
jgi:methyl-accepting chemotaxis protein